MKKKLVIVLIFVSAVALVTILVSLFSQRLSFGTRYFGVNSYNKVGISPYCVGLSYTKKNADIDNIHEYFSNKYCIGVLTSAGE